MAERCGGGAAVGAGVFVAVGAATGCDHTVGADVGVAGGSGVGVACAMLAKSAALIRSKQPRVSAMKLSCLCQVTWQRCDRSIKWDTLRGVAWSSDAWFINEYSLCLNSYRLAIE